MTPNQRKHFYFPAWHRCSQANSWQMANGRLLAALDEQQTLFTGWPDPAGPLALQVINHAANLANYKHRAATAEDLRHACNATATGGRTTSSGKLTNKEISRAVDLFNLLTDPWNIAAVTAWLHPEDGERQSVLSFLSKCANERLLNEIAHNAFKVYRYQDLPLEKLRWLLKQVKDRRAA